VSWRRYKDDFDVDAIKDEVDEDEPVDHNQDGQPKDLLPQVKPHLHPHHARRSTGQAENVRRVISGRQAEVEECVWCVTRRTLMMAITIKVVPMARLRQMGA
jgi:hypothetical protein